MDRSSVKAASRAAVAALALACSAAAAEKGSCNPDAACSGASLEAPDEAALLQLQQRKPCGPFNWTYPPASSRYAMGFRVPGDNAEGAPDAPMERPYAFIPNAFGVDLATKSIDWRATNAVTAVRSQVHCGACWAFSALETLESQYILRVGANRMQTFSVQQILSCARTWETWNVQGCAGGWPMAAYEYLMGMSDKAGLAQDGYWPYYYVGNPTQSCHAQDCTPACDKNTDHLPRYAGDFGPYGVVGGWFYAVPKSPKNMAERADMDSLAHALHNDGPISVCISVAVIGVFYRNEIIKYDDCKKATTYAGHCVQLVGVNFEAPTPYWILRNSWSPQWGDAGYMYLEYGKDKNTCGLADYATVPVMSDGESGSLVQLAFGKIPYYFYKYGEIIGGPDLKTEQMTLQDAREACSRMSECVAFTLAGNPPPLHEYVQVTLKGGPVYVNDVFGGEIHSSYVKTNETFGGLYAQAIMWFWDGPAPTPAPMSGPAA